MNSQKRLTQKLCHIIDLRVPGFIRNVPQDKVGQMAFCEVSSEKWYQEFLDRVHQSMGKSYLPVYRMADGEFIFCVGWKPGFPSGRLGFVESTWWKVKGKINLVLKKIEPTNKTIWGENYSGIYQDELILHFIRCLKNVATDGLLALHFTRSAGRFSEEYFESVCDWFEINRIELSQSNYTSFYFVYALFCGPDCKDLVRNRNLLLVTSADEFKRTKIKEYLIFLGAKTVQFVRISPDRSLLDKISLSEIEGTIDLALVAGGIGSVNILDQLKPLNTVCIDIGICMEIFADPSRRGRIFTVPDQSIV